MAEYNKYIEDQIQAGIVEEVPAKEDDKNQEAMYYLPHHGVVRKDKVTTKLRVVCDGSATAADREHSLNDSLLTGPNYIPQIFEMLVKFRVHPVGLLADIEKAFLMVGISAKDRDMLRFSWFTNIEHHDPELVQLRFCRLVFGLRPSPAILGATINHHLDTRRATNPEMVEHLHESLYVDDLMSGAQNDKKAFQIYEESKEIMSTGEFNLGKWHSNSNSLMQSINALEVKVVLSFPESKSGVIEEDLSYAKESITKESAPTSKTQMKVLGNIWDTDMLLFKFEELIEHAKSLPMTKRSFLKLSSKILDPLGAIHNQVENTLSRTVFS